MSDPTSKTLEILPTTVRALLNVVVPMLNLLLMVVVLKTEVVAKRLVEVIDVAIMLDGLKLVADKFVKNALVEVIEVPEAVVKVNRPAKFERLDIYKLVEVAFKIFVFTNTDEVANKLVEVMEVASKFGKKALVEVMLVPLAFTKTKLPAKFAKLAIYKFVDVKLTPTAELNVNNPLIVVVANTIVPLANTRKVLEAPLDPTLNIEDVTPVEEENTDRPP